LTNTKQSQETDILAAGGIRTRNPSKRAALDREATVIGRIDGRAVNLPVHKLTILVLFNMARTALRVAELIFTVKNCLTL
jgi:hypothetical protein